MGSQSERPRGTRPPESTPPRWSGKAPANRRLSPARSGQRPGAGPPAEHGIRFLERRCSRRPWRHASQQPDRPLSGRAQHTVPGIPTLVFASGSLRRGGRAVPPCVGRETPRASSGRQSRRGGGAREHGETCGRIAGVRLFAEQSDPGVWPRLSSMVSDDARPPDGVPATAGAEDAVVPRLAGLGGRCSLQNGGAAGASRFGDMWAASPVCP